MTTQSYRGVYVTYEIMVFGARCRHSWFFALWNWEAELLRLMSGRPEIGYRIIDVQPGEA